MRAARFTGPYSDDCRRQLSSAPRSHLLNTVVVRTRPQTERATGGVLSPSPAPRAQVADACPRPAARTDCPERRHLATGSCCTSVSQNAGSRTPAVRTSRLRYRRSGGDGTRTHGLFNATEASCTVSRRPDQGKLSSGSVDRAIRAPFVPQRFDSVPKRSSWIDHAAWSLAGRPRGHGLRQAAPNAHGPQVLSQGHDAGGSLAACRPSS